MSYPGYEEPSFEEYTNFLGDRSNRFTVSPTLDQARKTLVNTWWKDWSKNTDPLMFAVKPASAFALNQLAQDKRLPFNTLGEESIKSGRERLYVNDCVRLARRVNPNEVLPDIGVVEWIDPVTLNIARIRPQ